MGSGTAESWDAPGVVSAKTSLIYKVSMFFRFQINLDKPGRTECQLYVKLLPSVIRRAAMEL